MHLALPNIAENPSRTRSKFFFAPGGVGRVVKNPPWVRIVGGRGRVPPLPPLGNVACVRPIQNRAMILHTKYLSCYA